MEARPFIKMVGGKHQLLPDETNAAHWERTRGNGALWMKFHSLWTSCVGTPGYDKKKWSDLENLILRALR